MTVLRGIPFASLIGGSFVKTITAFQKWSFSRLIFNRHMKNRFRAALWFSVAAGVVGLLIMIYDLAQPHRDAQKKQILLLSLLFGAVPAVCAAVSGFLFSGDVLDPDKAKGTGRAATRGVVVALATWLMCAVAMTVYSYIINDRVNIVRLFVWVFLLGSLTFGWLIAAAGALVGMLLYRVRRTKPVN